MPTKLRSLLVVLLVVGLGVIAWQLWRAREQAHRVSELTDCLEDYVQKEQALGPGYWSGDEEHLDAPKAAIRQFGTNALPTLLRMIQAKDNAFKSNAIVLLKRRSLLSRHFHPDSHYHTLAVAGFQVLGRDAKGAVPILTRLLGDPALHCGALMSLGGIGPEAKSAVLGIMPFLEDRDVAGRWCAAEALGGIGPDASVAVPALVRHLDDTNRFVRTRVELALAQLHAHAELVVPRLVRHAEAGATSGPLFIAWFQALATYGTEAKPAVPVLIRISSEYGDAIGSAAAKALEIIDPEAASEAARRQGWPTRVERTWGGEGFMEYNRPRQL